jgi:copper chaperone CopZ
MEKTVLSVPKLWADHHVLTVRGVVTALDGVADVYASSAWKQLVVDYDPDKVDQDTIIGALAKAGYEVDEALGMEGTRLSAGDPAWDKLGVRVTKTNQRDREMSGEFRRY